MDAISKLEIDIFSMCSATSNNTPATLPFWRLMKRKR